VNFGSGNWQNVVESLTTSKFKITQVVGTIIHYLLPNFGNFNIQNPLIHPTQDITNLDLYMRNNIIYALIYSAALLILAILIFDRREV